MSKRMNGIALSMGPNWRDALEKTSFLFVRASASCKKYGSANKQQPNTVFLTKDILGIELAVVSRAKK